MHPITGKFENILCSLMQSALKIVESWCEDTELSVNPFKTEMVLFTRKRKIDALELPSLFGTSLSLSESVKYLGLILDKKFRWKAHLEAKIGKASIAFHQSRRAIDQSWGLNPQQVLWLYTMVVRPMFCYVALVWWPRVRLKTSIEALDHLQRLVCLSATGAMKTTPTAALEAVLGVTPLNLFVEESALKSALRLHRGGLCKFSTPKGHLKILEEAFKDQPLLEAASDCITPTYNFEKAIVVNLEQVDSSSTGVTIYTDGSKTNFAAGTGIFSRDLDLQESIPLGKHCSILQSEVLGIARAANIILDKKINNKRIHIVSDSKAALRAIGSIVATSKAVLESSKLLTLASRNNSVLLS